MAEQLAPIVDQPIVVAVQDQERVVLAGRPRYLLEFAVAVQVEPHSILVLVSS